MKKSIDTPDTETQESETTGYKLITSDQFIFMDPGLNIVLYPGVSAVVTGEQFSKIPDWTRSMITAQDISEAEFTKMFKASGIMGIIR